MIDIAKNKAGRKGKYSEWLLPDKLEILQDWSRNGATDVIIAKNIGISVSTLYEWKNRFPEFADALKVSKDYADAKVESALFESALMGNVTAQIFWLKNRRPKQWREKQEETNEESLSKLDSVLKKIDEGMKE